MQHLHNQLSLRSKSLSLFLKNTIRRQSQRAVYEQNLERNVNTLRSLELFSLLNAKNRALDNGKHKKSKNKSMKNLPPLKNNKIKKKKAPVNPFFQMVVDKANLQRKKFNLKQQIEPLERGVFGESGIDFKKVADYYIDKYSSLIFSTKKVLEASLTDTKRSKYMDQDLIFLKDDQEQFSTEEQESQLLFLSSRVSKKSQSQILASEYTDDPFKRSSQRSKFAYSQDKSWMKRHNQIVTQINYSQKGKIIIRKMQKEINAAQKLLNMWKNKVKKKEKVVQNLHKQFYLLTISNPLKELKGRANKIEVRLESAIVTLSTTQDRTDTLKKMKNDRQKDMVIHKHPFMMYTQLLPLLTRYVAKSESQMVNDQEHMTRLLYNLTEMQAKKDVHLENWKHRVKVMKRKNLYNEQDIHLFIEMELLERNAQRAQLLSASYSKILQEQSRLREKEQLRNARYERKINAAKDIKNELRKIQINPSIKYTWGVHKYDDIVTELLYLNDNIKNLLTFDEMMKQEIHQTKKRKRERLDTLQNTEVEHLEAYTVAQTEQLILIRKKSENLDTKKARNDKKHGKMMKDMVKMSDLGKAVRHLYFLVFQNPSEYRKKDLTKTEFNFHTGQRHCDYQKSIEQLSDGIDHYIKQHEVIKKQLGSNQRELEKELEEFTKDIKQTKQEQQESNGTVKEDDQKQEAKKPEEEKREDENVPQEKTEQKKEIKQQEEQKDEKDQSDPKMQDNNDQEEENKEVEKVAEKEST